MDHNQCKLCIVARKSINAKAKATRPPIPKTQNVVKLCRVCLTEIKPGKRHQCCQSSRFANMCDMAGNLAEPLAARTIHTKMTQPRATNGEVELANLRGKRTRIQVNPKEPKQKEISHQRMLQIKAGLNLSANKVLFFYCN